MGPQRIDFTETIVEAPPNLFHFLFFSYNKIQKRKNLLLPVYSIKMPLAQIFFVRAGGISSTFNQNFLTQQKIHTRYKNRFHLVH